MAELLISCQQTVFRDQMDHPVLSYKYLHVTLSLLRTKQRKCHLLPHCLSLSTETMNVKYRQKFNVGKVMSDSALAKDRGKNNTYTDVTCFPLFGVLRAMGVSKVDYFSLDVEGNEMDVLRTIPFDELEITVR